MRFLLLLVAACVLSACASGSRRTAAVDVAATVDPTVMSVGDRGQGGDYRIGSADKLKLAVFQVPDLSFDEIFVDASGQLQLPLIGAVSAAGLTPDELSTEIARRLGDRYLRDPQVTVTVAQAASQKVTVDGAVVKPGVYEMRGRTTLLQAIAMAEGPSPIANLGSVAVFRTVDARPMVAVFDLASIRGGQAQDPILLGDDVVVVDTSRLNARLRDIIAALPGIAAFAYF